MEFVRLVHPRNFDKTLGRFNDLAFKKSSGGGGMSVFELTCAEAASGLGRELINGTSGDLPESAFEP